MTSKSCEATLTHSSLFHFPLIEFLRLRYESSHCMWETQQPSELDESQILRQNTTLHLHLTTAALIWRRMSPRVSAAASL